MDHNAINGGLAALVPMVVGGFLMARPHIAKQVLLRWQVTDYSRRSVEALPPQGLRVFGVILFCAGVYLGLAAAGFIY